MRLDQSCDQKKKSLWNRGGKKGASSCKKGRKDHQSDHSKKKRDKEGQAFQIDWAALRAVKEGSKIHQEAIKMGGGRRKDLLHLWD